MGDELKEQNAVLRDCIEQLAVVESARANLVSLLQEALQEQVYCLEQKFSFCCNLFLYLTLNYSYC